MPATLSVPLRKSALLPAAIEQRFQPHHAGSAPDIEGADPFGPVDFVGREAHQIDVGGSTLTGILPTAWVASVCRDAALAAEVADFGQRLDGADFVVGQHDGDQDRVVADGRGQLLRAGCGRPAGRARG